MRILAILLEMILQHMKLTQSEYKWANSPTTNPTNPPKLITRTIIPLDYIPHHH
jgi:hypothetical protein